MINARHCLSRRCVTTQAAMKPQIMVNSCTGKMGQSVSESVLRAGLELIPYTLCAPGENATKSHVTVGGGGRKMDVELLPPEVRDAKVAELKKKYPALIMVDYTAPDAIHQQVRQHP